MPKGRTTFYDLPDGSGCLAAFAAGNSPGFGGAAGDLRADRSVASLVPLIAHWSDGPRDPPATLVELVAILRFNSLASPRPMNGYATTAPVSPTR